jgi:restriction system protein
VRFAAAQQAHADAERRRQARVQDLQARHQAAVQQAQAEATKFNEQLEAWATGVRERRREDVERYLMEILAATPLPRGLPRKAEVTFDAENEHVVVRLQLPGVDVIPAVREVAYIKSRGEFVERPRPARECADLYKNLISQVSLLAIRDLFDGDKELAKVSFNGHVSRTHPATGQPDYPCLLTLNRSIVRSSRNSCWTGLTRTSVCDTSRPSSPITPSRWKQSARWSTSIAPGMPSPRAWTS